MNKVQEKQLPESNANITAVVQKTGIKLTLQSFNGQRKIKMLNTKKKLRLFLVSKTEGETTQLWNRSLSEMAIVISTSKLKPFTSKASVRANTLTGIYPQVSFTLGKAVVCIYNW